VADGPQRSADSDSQTSERCNSDSLATLDPDNSGPQQVRTTLLLGKKFFTYSKKKNLFLSVDRGKVSLVRNTGERKAR
jgi:hypothetical protein